MLKIKIMNTRIILSITLVSLSLLFSSCSKTLNSDGSTAIISENRVHAEYENVMLQGVFETKIKQGESYAVEIIATEHVLDNIHSRVSRNTLEISMDDIQYGDIQVDIIITMPSVAEITKLGVGSTRIEGFYDLKTLEIHHDGVAAFSMEGSVDQLSLENTGIGSFEGFDLQVKNCSIDQSGIGHVKLNCSESIKGELNGIGNIYYKGDPSIDVEINGIGNLKNAN